MKGITPRQLGWLLLAACVPAYGVMYLYRPVSSWLAFGLIAAVMAAIMLVAVNPKPPKREDVIRELRSRVAWGRWAETELRKMGEEP